VGEEKDDGNESYDSGYHSDVIHEEDEGEGEASVSPTASMLPAKRSRDVPRECPRQRSTSRTRSPSGRRPSWRPNLKHDLSMEHLTYRNQSIDSTMSTFDESSETSSISERSITPTLSRPQPKRKSSSLLHPSPPLESTEDRQDVHAITSAESTPVTALLQEPENTTSPTATKAFPFNFSLPTTQSTPPPTSAPRPSLHTLDHTAMSSTLHPTSAPRPVPHSSASAPMEIPRRPGIAYRKNSTLLHPSPPPEESPLSAPAPFILPIHAKTILSLPPTPKGTPITQCFPLRRTPSGRSPAILPATTFVPPSPTEEWEEPLHSSHSDGEDESDDFLIEECTAEIVPQKAVIARTGRMARASRISLSHDGNSNALRILQDI
jgi:hypothetical protein